MKNNENETETENRKRTPSENIWTRILWAGLGETFIRVGSVIVAILLCGVVIVFASRHYLSEKRPETVST